VVGRFSDDQVVDAFVYLIARYLVIRQEHIDLSEPGVGYNTIKYNELGKAEFVNPNLDVAYLEAWVAVDAATPCVLTVPAIDGRYFTAQICDEWAEIITNINELSFPDRPFGDFALCLEGSDPDIPEGAVRIDLPSPKAKILARVERQGDDESAVSLQHQFTIRSMGRPSVASAIEIAMFSNEAPITVAAFDKALVEEVLASAPDSLPSSDAHQEVVLEIAELAEHSDDVRAAIDNIIVTQGWPAIIEFIRNYGDKRGGWIATTGKPTGFGDDHWFRAAANFAGIWWNTNTEVVYFIGEQDSDGDALNGSHQYMLHYRPDDLPVLHVNAYWSLTLMSLPDYRVVPNQLDRHNLSNLSDLTYEPDGSLKLYLGAALPVGAPQSNWLPAPDGGPFTLNHRLYRPKPEVLNGNWYTPALTRI